MTRATAEAHRSRAFSRSGESLSRPLDMQELSRLIWARRRMVIGVAGACAVGGMLISLLRPVVYESSLTLSVAPSKVGQFEISSQVNVPAFVPMIQSHAVVQPVVREFGLAEPPTGLSVSRFLDEALSVRPIPDTNLIQVVVRLGRPDLAARVANAIVAGGVELARKVNESEISAARDGLKALLDEAAARLREAEAQYEEYRRTAQLELVRKDVDTLLAQRADLRTVVLAIEAERGKLERAEAELAERSRTGTLKRNIDADPALMEIAKGSGLGGRELLGLTLTQEYLDGVYDQMERSAAESRTRLGSLERHRNQLLRGSKVDGDQLARLSELYMRESRLASLEMERALARKTYEDVAARYQGARLQAAGRTPQLVVVDSAVPAERPVSRFVARNALFGLLAGLPLGGLLAILLQLVSRSAHPLDRSRVVDSEAPGKD